MGSPVVHFEIIGKDPPKLRRYYGELFGWTCDTNSPVAKEVSEPGNYGFIDRNTTPDGVGIPGGIGGGTSHEHHAIFYVGVPDVEAALRQAERLGGKRIMGPAKNPQRQLVVAHFADPEGNVVGLAGPA
jgi:predicted enzyme related to lactoylglutathione lyase